MIATKNLIKLKKIISYPFDQDFIRRQARAIAYLDELCNLYREPQDELLDVRNQINYRAITDLRNQINECWNLDDITKLLAKQIKSVLWGQNSINIKIFDLKTKWFLWNNIMLSADLIKQEKAQEDAKLQLNTLRYISSIFDLGS